MIRKSPFDSAGRAIFKPGFVLQYHSINQVEQANDHLSEVSKKRNYFNAEEQRWILNERALCRCDFLYWATRYGFIVDWKGNAVRFNPHLPQRILLDVMSSMEEKSIAILVMVLKARQEGVTTLSELIMLWKTIFFPYSNTLVASSRPEKSEEMVEKMEFAYGKQPSWLVPPVSSYNKGEKIAFDSQNSAINIRHGALMSGMGRGSTAFSFHLSEVTEFTNPKESIDASLLKAAHDNPELIGILESTGKERHGWWYDRWQYSVEFWPQGMARLCPVFLPYYIMRDLYPTPAWLRARPVPLNWEIPELAQAHAQRAREYVQSGQNQIVTKTLGSGWEMPLEQIWYWWVTRNEHVSAGSLNDFYRELCADDKEAFQSANSTIFSPEVTENFRARAKMPVGVYGIQAPQAEIPVELQAREADIDSTQPSIDIVANWSNPKHTYRLVPLLHRGSAPFSPNGKIIMYERPKQGYTYGLGIDTGYGLGQDFSVIQGLRKGDAERNDEQVFEFASPQINSFTLWPFALALGTLYSTVVDGKRRQPRIVIEGAANGENVYNELKKRGWREFHNWVRYDKKRVQEFKANRQLWYTTSWSRPLMMDLIFDALNNGWLDVNSPWFIDELADLELILERNKIAAAVGRHDDRFMALGIVLFSLHALETRGRDGWQARRARQDDAPVSYLTYSPGAQGSVEADIYNDPITSYSYRVANPELEDPEPSPIRIAR